MFVLINLVIHTKARLFLENENNGKRSSWKKLDRFLHEKITVLQAADQKEQLKRHMPASVIPFLNSTQIQLAIFW